MSLLAQKSFWPIAPFARRDQQQSELSSARFYLLPRRGDWRILGEHALGTIDESGQLKAQSHNARHSNPGLGALALLRTATFQTACSETNPTPTPRATIASSRHSAISIKREVTLEGTKWEEASSYNETDDITAASTEEDKGQMSLSQKGSIVGLSEKSREAVQWIHKIPNYAKPIVSSFFNMLDVPSAC